MASNILGLALDKPIQKYHNTRKRACEAYQYVNGIAYQDEVLSFT